MGDGGDRRDVVEVERRWEKIIGKDRSYRSIRNGSVEAEAQVGAGHSQEAAG